MRKPVVMALCGLLMAASLAPPADAARKKARYVPGELRFYLRWDGEGSQNCDGLVHLSVFDGEDPGNSCEYVAQPAQEVLIASGQEPLARRWPATDGLPFRLDASRPVTGEIAVRGAGAARAWVDVALSGAGANGKGHDIVEGQSQMFDMVLTAQTGPALARFELRPQRSLHRMEFHSLELATATRGLTAASYIELENPASFIVVPVLVPKRA